MTFSFSLEPILAHCHPGNWGQRGISKQGEG
jgi:hypothetical protein